MNCSYFNQILSILLGYLLLLPSTSSFIIQSNIISNQIMIRPRSRLSVITRMPQHIMRQKQQYDDYYKIPYVPTWANYRHSLYQSLNNNESDRNDDDNDSVNENYNDYTEQIKRRRKRRRQSEHEQQIQPPNKHIHPTSSTRPNKSTIKKQATFKKKSNDNFVSEYKQPLSSCPSSKSYYDILRKRRRRQLKNDHKKQSSSYIDEIIISNSIDISKQAINNVKSVAKKTAKTSKRIMKDIGDGINSFIEYDDDSDNRYRGYKARMDENGVQEVDWYYVSKDDGDNNVGWVMKRKKKSRGGNKSRPKGQSNSFNDVNNYDGDKERVRQKRRQVKKRQYIDESIENSSDDHLSKTYNVNTTVNMEKTVLLLPPTSLENVYFPSGNNDNSSCANFLKSEPKNETKNEFHDSYVSSRSRKRVPNDKTKKVYSVYPIQDEDDAMKENLEEFYGKVTAEAIDSVGNLMVDVMEGKYIWNPTDEASDSKEQKIYDLKEQDLHHRRKKKQSFKRHWRDRLNERFDYALGVHEDGRYYKSWEEQLKRERNLENGNDPVSIFYGRQKGDHGAKRKVHFWEEDGSLMSLFFGRTPNGQKLSFSVSLIANVFNLLFYFY